MGGIGRTTEGLGVSYRHWLNRGWVTRRHIDLQRIESSLCPR